jgi:tetratricopeptide (TPR) repeat protein
MISDRNAASPPGGLDNLFRDAAEHHQRGRLDEAARGYQTVLSIDPGHFDALHLFGVLRAQQGSLPEAEKLLRRAIARNPQSGRAHNNLGMTLNLMKRPEEAIAPLERAISLNQRDPIAHNNLGNALKAIGQQRPALASFERAVALKPDYVEALSNLGAALYELNRSAEAIPLLEEAIALNPAFAEAHLNLGGVLKALGRSKAAAACFERALQADPRNPIAHQHIGAMHMENGRFAEARHSLERALLADPQNTRLLFDVVQCGRVAADDLHFATLVSLAENAAALPEETRLWLHFALGKAYADTGQEELAFRHLREGNALKRRRTQYDEATSLQFFDRVRAVFSADLMTSRDGFGNPSERPIFVLGMMRSGSTLVEQILASHPDVFAAGELQDFNEVYKAVRATIVSSETYPDTVPLLTAEQLRRIGDEYLARIEAHTTAGRAASRITDKLPGNFNAVGLIRLALPNARIIHTIRDPVDTCLSCYSKLFGGEQPFAYHLGELGRYYRAYAQLMAHWHRVLPEGAILDVRYEELVGDFENQVRRILDYSGLEWNEACLSFYETDRPVTTISQAQVRQPLYNTSVRRWRPDDAILRPLLDGLGSDIDRILRGEDG